MCSIILSTISFAVTHALKSMIYTVRKLPSIHGNVCINHEPYVAKRTNRRFWIWFKHPRAPIFYRWHLHRSTNWTPVQSVWEIRGRWNLPRQPWCLREISDSKNRPWNELAAAQSVWYQSRWGLSWLIRLRHHWASTGVSLKSQCLLHWNDKWLNFKPAVFQSNG